MRSPCPRWCCLAIGLVSLPAIAQPVDGDAGLGSVGEVEPSAQKTDDVARHARPHRVIDEEPVRFVLGARLGVGLPVRLTLDGGDLWPRAHWASLNTPIQLDFGARLGFGLVLGGSFQLAPHHPSVVSESALSFRLGLQADFRFVNGRNRLVPWLGGAVGWEWLTARDGTSLARDYLLSGPTGTLQGGFDIRLGKHRQSGAWTLGPYLAVQITHFLWAWSMWPLPSAELATHALIIFGVRSSVTF